jgi:predicted adenylyl cyclase CyaB
MCTEIEAKLRVDSLSEIEQKLTELGARFVGEQLQTDYFFDDINATLTKEDRCLRLRKQIVGNNKSCFLTYKGAKEKSNLKKRQEIESEINDADSIHKLLLALGYEQALIVEKKRMLWQFGNCEVALDRLPLLGDFVEIEGPDEETIANVQNILGLTDLPHISKSYASLLTDRLQHSDK